MESRVIGPGFAVELTGVDIGQDQPDAVWEEIRDLWLANKVMVIRDQRLDDDDMIRFAERFGPTYVYVRDQFNDKDRPQVTLLSNIEEAGRRLGDLGDGEVHWHTDQAYSEEGAFGTILYGVEIPAEGGNTCYCDLAQAHDGLSAELKKRIEGRRQTFSITKAAEVQRIGMPEAQRLAKPPISLPIVRTHPYTGCKVLFISPNHATGIDDMGQDESDALLEELHAHAMSPAYFYRHEWRVGDLVIHDNTSTIHRRDSFPPSQRRMLRRTGFLLPEDARARF